MSRYVRDTFAMTQGDVTYEFSKPISANRAPLEFRKARDAGLPSGSIIEIDYPEETGRIHAKFR